MLFDASGLVGARPWPNYVPLSWSKRTAHLHPMTAHRTCRRKGLSTIRRETLETDENHETNVQSAAAPKWSWYCCRRLIKLNGDCNFQQLHLIPAPSLLFEVQHKTSKTNQNNYLTNLRYPFKKHEQNIIFRDLTYEEDIQKLDTLLDKLDILSIFARRALLL